MVIPLKHLNFLSFVGVDGGCGDVVVVAAIVVVAKVDVIVEVILVDVVGEVTARVVVSISIG